MEYIYSFLDTVLPFEWLQYNFMKNAFLGSIIISILFGLIGTMVVNNKMAFFSDALGHSALTGIALGVIFGIVNPVYSMLIFAVFFAIASDLLTLHLHSKPNASGSRTRSR
jgi:zinc transport system permease protein